MHHRRGLARATCSARNAYNPALALASALLPAHDIALTRTRPWTASTNANLATLFPQRRTLIASRHDRDAQQATADAADGRDEDAQQEKPRTKGTLAGYEDLMGSSIDVQQTRQNSSDLAGSQRDNEQVVGERPFRNASSDTAKRSGAIYARPSGFGKFERERKLKKANTVYQRIVSPNDNADSNGNQSPRRGSGLVRPPLNWKERMHRIGEEANNIAKQKPQFSTTELNAMRRKMHYDGVPFPPEASPLDEQTPLPWAYRSVNKTSQGLHILEREMNMLYKHLAPTQEEQAARRSVRMQLESFVAQHVGDSLACKIFGSTRTALFSGTSDLDFRVHLRGRRDDLSRDAVNAIFEKMTSLTRAFDSSSDWIVTVLRNARYPIINTQHRMTGIDIQIVASPSTDQQHKLTMQYLKAIPNLHRLYFVAKTMLAMRGLTDVYNGGTGSYGLFMMLVASLTRRGAQQHSDAHIGRQLLQFLDFWCEHDCSKNGISLAALEPGAPPLTKPFRKHRPAAIPRAEYIRRAYARKDPVRAGQWSIGQVRPFQPYLPCIQDPANPLNDLGRKMNAIKHIVATFDQIRTDLRAAMSDMDALKLPKGASLLEPAVGRCHEVYAERRRRLQEYGAAVKAGYMESGQTAAERLEVHKKQRQARRREGAEERSQQQDAAPRQPVASVWEG